MSPQAYVRTVNVLCVHPTVLLCRSLDKKVRSGLTKLTWVTQGNLDQFVSDCCMHATRVTQVIEPYKSSNLSGGHVREGCAVRDDAWAGHLLPSTRDAGQEDTREAGEHFPFSLSLFQHIYRP